MDRVACAFTRAAPFMLLKAAHGLPLTQRRPWIRFEGFRPAIASSDTSVATTESLRALLCWGVENAVDLDNIVIEQTPHLNHGSWRVRWFAPKFGSESEVLVRCRGGLGRAGTIAARLLVELGMDPATAIAGVRAVRRGTIETSDQEKFVLNFGTARK
jgi:hypothetical protein